MYILTFVGSKCVMPCSVKFFRAKAECFSCLCHRLDVCLSVHLSHSWSVSKQCKLGSRNLHCGLRQRF